MKMKKFLFVALAAIACVFLFSSCDDRFEIRTSYEYRYSISGMDDDARGITSRYIDELQWHHDETEDNDASSKNKAAEENDREAIEEFNENVAKFREQSLYDRYAKEGIQSVTGTITYTLTRLPNDYRDGEVLRTKEIEINYHK